MVESLVFGTGLLLLAYFLFRERLNKIFGKKKRNNTLKKCHPIAGHQIYFIYSESFKNISVLTRIMMKKGKYNLTKYILDVMGFGLILGSALIIRLAPNDYVLILAGVLVSIGIALLSLSRKV